MIISLTPERREPVELFLFGWSYQASKRVLLANNTAIVSRIFKHLTKV